MSYQFFPGDDWILFKLGFKCCEEVLYTNNLEDETKCHDFLGTHGTWLVFQMKGSVSGFTFRNPVALFAPVPSRCDIYKLILPRFLQRCITLIQFQFDESPSVEPFST